MDFHFDDDLFGRKTRSTAIVLDSYKAKIIEPKGFLNVNNQNDDLNLDDVLNLKKTQADYFYFIKQYSKARDLYRECLGKLNNLFFSML